jgi:hypothetical protein
VDFSIPRARMLDVLADAMEVPPERRSALLGRFQHLQRLALIDGINPGRGRAAEYKSHHLVVIALAFQMLQLGLTPERTVQVIKQNQDTVRLGIGLAVHAKDTISPSMLWFDPAILTRSQDEIRDLADATFDYGGAGTGAEVFARLFVEGWVQRTSFISISGTLWHVVAVFEGWGQFSDKPRLGEQSRIFLGSLSKWFQGSKPDSLA